MDGSPQLTSGREMVLSVISQLRTSVSTRFWLCGALAVTLLAGGCGLPAGSAGPSKAGSAAIVGQAAIPLSDAQQWHRDMLSANRERTEKWRREGRLDQLGRSIASALVTQELARQVAQEQGLQVTDSQVDAVLAQSGQSPEALAASGGPQRQREVVRAGLVAEQLGAREMQQAAVTFDLTGATTRKEAETKAQRMAQGPAEADAVLQADLASGLQPFENTTMHAAQQPDFAADSPLFSAAPGTVVTFQLQPQSDSWAVARIEDRRMEPAPGPANPQAGNPQYQVKFGERLLAMHGQQVGVELSPRYGVWDSLSLTAVPNPGETAGLYLK